MRERTLAVRRLYLGSAYEKTAVRRSGPRKPLDRAWKVVVYREKKDRLGYHEAAGQAEGWATRLHL